MAKKFFVFFAMERPNESNVRTAMESAVSGLQSALTQVSTVLTQLQMGRMPAAEECAAGRETAERNSDDFESRPKKMYNYIYVQVIPYIGK